MSDILMRLAAAAGIEEGYWDTFGNHHGVDDNARRFLLSCMGIAADNDEDAAQSLLTIENRDWKNLLPPVCVGRGDQPPSVDVYIPENQGSKTLTWRIVLEDGEERSGRSRCGDLPTWGTRHVEGREYLKKSLRLPGGLPIGYHDLEIDFSGRTASCRIIQAPSRSFLPDWLNRGERKWGLASHLYAPRHKTDWGIGDFTTLRKIVGLGHDLGADVIGLNPLHALFPGCPEHASPYSPSSRLFLNPLFIDLESVPEYKAVKKDLPAGFAKQLASARKTTHVDYTLVAALKNQAFALMFDAFQDSKGERHKAFDAFRADMGRPLEIYCLFEALTQRYDGKRWSTWPKGYQNPEARAVKAFAKENPDRVSYFAYLQWLADSQLGEAARDTDKAGMAVGLYRDLAVGVDPNGAEAWADQASIAGGVQFGAPGDALNPLGQAWGAPPYLPLALREAAYAPFIAVLRSNMRHAGALRIDHAMALQHLFWIPNGADARSGAYISYNMDEMLAVVALESHRQECLVIGEDLGTVPEGFQERMDREGILSYKVLYFERWPDGLFKRPDAYPRLSLATPTTHDLPTLLGHWKGDDLAIRRRLHLFENEDQINGDEANRVQDRNMLIDALVDQGLLPPDFSRHESLSDDDRLKFLTAVHGFAARTNSALAMIGIDDLAMEMEQLNMPGTVTEYPNWRRRITPTIESLAGREDVRHQTQGARDERG
ncbi:4-alpha-glucanotransferase [Magnetospira sp. QH-2]|uniref:4-alpha-glucanotransferase n=1 Tax=Magnetospira sp. (strain QH-2) TaxID=1288970 RepID=UPI0003E80DAF|nr:4-alpha-glucanotransferase [Magnetospira sp. QH-2]CCQ75031.1 GH77 : related to 4-a-glucanotransferase [Magnetospira sp. QH-2]